MPPKILSGLVLLLWLPVIASAATVSLTIDVFIDGVSDLRIQGTTLQWYNGLNIGPKNLNPSDATITGAVDGVPVFGPAVYVNGNSGTTNQGLTPLTFTLPSYLALPSATETVAVSEDPGVPLQRFASVTATSPTAGNGFMATIRFDHRPYLNPAEFKATVIFERADISISDIPEPPA